ncbi:hypothetical protein BJA01nite_64010 [Bradyrhizobium japonicum]|nr:hypothetical protein BJA01nite_64010 [Bradyrhizobium japonicum]
MSESAITTQTDVMAITAFSSADTVRRFSIEAPLNFHCKVRRDAPATSKTEGHADRQSHAVCGA